MSEERWLWYCNAHGSMGIPGTEICEMTGQVAYIDSMIREGHDPNNPKFCDMVEIQIVRKRRTA